MLLFQNIEKRHFHSWIVKQLPLKILGIRVGIQKPLRHFENFTKQV
jgi:hypothetical protein